MRRFVLPLLLATVLMAVVASPALATDDGGDTSTTIETTTTSPDSGDGADEDTDVRVAPWWLLILVGAALVMIVIALATRGSVREASPPPVSWKDRAQAGYANGRWLADIMSEDLAVWRGNTLDEGSASSSASDATHAANWELLPQRFESAKSTLYALEASAPDVRTASIAHTTIAALDRLRSATDQRADARANYRAVETTGGAAEADLTAAREREIRASTQMHRARRDLSDALEALGSLR